MGVVHSMRGGQTNEQTVQYYLQTLNAKLDAYEAILSKQKYVAGNVSPCPLCGTPISVDVDSGFHCCL